MEDYWFGLVQWFSYSWIRDSFWNQILGGLLFFRSAGLVDFSPGWVHTCSEVVLSWIRSIILLLMDSWFSTDIVNKDFSL